MKPGHSVIFEYIVLSLALCLGVPAACAIDTEDDPVINSNEVLGSGYLSSTFHRVENVGYNNGFYFFNVESDFGRYDIVSLPLLKKRVDEIKTLGQAINQFERENEQLSGELRSTLRVTGNSAVDILTNPFGTASQLAGQLRDNLGDTLAGENPFIEEYALRYSYAEPDDPTTAAHKRNIAYQMQLDLYSNNYRVQSFLNSVANARSAGRVSAGVGLGNAFFNTSRQSALDKQIRFTLKTKTLHELDQYHRELLNNLGVQLLVADAFMQQPFLSPGNRTVMLAYLNQIKSTANLAKLVELITTTDNEVTTIAFERLCKALYFYHQRFEPLTNYVKFKNQPAAITANREIIFFEYKDLLTWSESNQARYKRLAELAREAGYPSWKLVALGRLSNSASQELSGLGYQPDAEFLSGLSD